MYKFIDLFCGIGGFRSALEKKGLECVFSSDIDEKAAESYRKNFGDKPKGDITEISEKKIPAHDILCAGFPCQSFSISGDMKGLDDNRGRLFYEIIRIAQYHQPYVLLLENVKNILTVDDGQVIKTIETKLDEIGYRLHKHVLNASYFGIPQSRERVYFVGLRKDTGAKSKLSYSPPIETRKRIFLEDVLEKDIEPSLFITRDDMVIDRDDKEHALEPIRVGQVNKGGQGERIYSVKGHAITLSAYGGGAGARTGLYLVKDRVRKLSITECKTLMGFPSIFHVSEGIQGYQQLGNAVIPAMISHVYDSIKLS
ncbi:MAG: DNA cytosine methyltransferase [Candidatus Omnitrophota bacterium]|nr:DNA cytosine methyltransferase [Candidatus Omnitrophota bacterium]